MVSNRCKMFVVDELLKLGLHSSTIELGMVDVKEKVSALQLEKIKGILHNSGLELMYDKKIIVVEKIKGIIIEMLYKKEDVKINFSNYLSKKLNLDYTYLSNLFSDVQGTTIEKFTILHKIEMIKELIIYDELSITEISYIMKYTCSTFM